MPTPEDYVNKLPQGFLAWGIILGVLSFLIGLFLWWLFGGAS